jgi:hypothetical protein
LLFLTGISALASGFMMMLEPSGKLMGWSTVMLSGSPFNDFLVPGIVLFITVGLVCSYIFIMMVRGKQVLRLLFAEGCILIVWIGVQIFIIKPLNFLQVFIFITGVLFILYSVFQLKKHENSSKSHKNT